MNKKVVLALTSLIVIAVIVCIGLVFQKDRTIDANKDEMLNENVAESGEIEDNNIDEENMENETMINGEENTENEDDISIGGNNQEGNKEQNTSNNDTNINTSNSSDNRESIITDNENNDRTNENNNAENNSEAENLENETMEEEKNMEERKIKILVNNKELTATLLDNSSVDALLEDLSKGDISIDMSDYASMEKVGSLGKSYPRNDENHTTKAGDLILYLGNSFVIYYDTNTWNFTKLGEIDDITQDELKEILGTGNVKATLSIK